MGEENELTQAQRIRVEALTQAVNSVVKTSVASPVFITDGLLERAAQFERFIIESKREN